MKSNHVSISGFVGTEPKSRLVNDEDVVTDFRLAWRTRIFDRKENAWVDGRPTWVTVNCWGALARNVSSSLTVGSRVMVQGRLISSEWESKNGRRSRVDIRADSIGFDLEFGRASFERVNFSQTHELPGQRESDALAEEVEQDGFDADLDELLAAADGGRTVVGDAEAPEDGREAVRA